MTEVTDTEANPLLKPIPDTQRTLLKVIGDAVITTGSWPVYQYVQAMMDESNLELDQVMAAMPAINDGMQLRYSLVKGDRNGGDAGKLKLTVAGLAHLDEFNGTVSAFLDVVARLAEQRASGLFDPTKVVEVVVPLDQIVDGLADTPLVDISDLIDSEPATWHNQIFERDGERLVQTSPFIRRFRGVRTVEEYLDRLRAFIMPPAPKAPPVPPPALALVQAFDYLNVVWLLAFKAQLVFVPNAERAARLAFPADTAEAFDNRLSSLCEMIKGLQVPLVEGGDRKWGSLKRLSTYLPEQVGPEGAPACLTPSRPFRP